MNIGLAHYLTVAAILFTIGIFGIFLNRRNVIIILMSIELILLAVNINLVAFRLFSEIWSDRSTRFWFSRWQRRKPLSGSPSSWPITATAARLRSRTST